MQQALDMREGDRRHVRIVARQCHCPVDHRQIVADFIHETVGQGLRRRDRTAAKQQFRGPPPADQSQHPLRSPCAGQETDLDFGQTDLIVARRCNPEIAGQAEFEPTAHGETVDCGNGDFRCR